MLGVSIYIGPAYMVAGLLAYVLLVIGMWPCFVKAGHPGWAAIIPFVNLYFVTRIAQRSVLWFILLLIPIVNIVTYVFLAMDVARNFGKSQSWGLVMLWLLQFVSLGFIGWMMLGYGAAQYRPFSGRLAVAG